RAWRRRPEEHPVLFVAMQLMCGVILAALLVLFERAMGRSVDPAAVDLRHFSLHPWTAPRLATLAGILLGHAAVLWLCALACVMPAVHWRLPRRASPWHVACALLWILPTAVAASVGARRGW